jgi:hypothetical protein
MFIRVSKTTAHRSLAIDLSQRDNRGKKERILQERDVMQTQTRQLSIPFLFKAAGRYSLLLLLPVLIFLGYEYWLIVTDRTGTYFMKAEVADLNGDGYLDVLQHGMRKESETTAFSGTILWWNQGNGRFTMERLEGGWDAAVGDLDGDGDTDIAVYILQRVETFLNQGGVQGGEMGRFKQNKAVSPPKNVDQFGTMTTADFNGDGKLDGFIAGCCGKAYFPDDGRPSISWVWLNHWDSEGLKYEVLSLDDLDGLAIREAVVGDLNGNGSLDIFLAITSKARDPQSRVLLNDGSGNFRDAGQRLGEADLFTAALGDVDGDGDLDILMGGHQGAAIWINEGGRFTRSPQRFPGLHVRSVVLADLDLDGDLDALIGNRKEVVVWWNDGQGGLTRSDQKFRFSVRHNAAVADFNNDGWPDIFLHAYDSSYQVLWNMGNGQFQ